MSVITNPAIRWQNDRLYFVGMASAILATVIVGFAWSFLRTDILFKQLESTWVKTHALAFTAWILLYFCQTLLVFAQRFDLHRRVGLAGATLAGLMIALALGSGISGFSKSPPRPAIDHFMLYVVVHVDMVMFVIFVAGGLLFRNWPQTHKRLMLLATIALMDAVIERLPLIFHISVHAHYVILDMFVVCGIVYDLISRGRVHPAYIWGLLIIVIFPPGARALVTAVTPHLVGVVG
jgi:hypothetical protein